MPENCITFSHLEKISEHVSYRPVGSVAKHTLSVQEVCGSILEPVKSTQFRQRLTTAATFRRICVAQALCRGYEPRYTLRQNTASIYNDDLNFLIFGACFGIIRY